MSSRLLAAVIVLSVAPLAARAAPAASAQSPIGAVMQARIDSDVETSLRATHTEAATIAIVEGGRVVYMRGYGLRDAVDALPADAGTRYEVGSITKQFAAVAILQLKEAGKVDLDAPLAKYLPQAPHAADVTIRQLLTQTSGFPDFIIAPNIEALVGTPVTFDQLMARIADKPLDFKPGTQWEYSSTNYLILGRVVELLSGQTWDDYVRERIFAAAGMANSSTIAQEGTLPDMARGYVYANGKTAASVPVDESWAGAAGGIVSTVGDLAAWHDALAAGKIISADDYRLLATPTHFVDGSSSQYGFGLFVDTYDDQPRVWHNGNTFGFDASDQWFTSQDVRIIVLTNSADGGSDELVARLFNELFPAIASAALNGAAGAAPGLAEKLAADAQAVTTDMAPVDIYRRALATMRSVDAPAYLQFKQQSNTTFTGSNVVIQHFVHLERTADRTYKVRDVDVYVARNVIAAVFPPDLFLGRASTATPAPDTNAFPLGLDEVDPKLKTIATTIAKSAYVITLTGVEYLPGCGAAIHLKLEPLRDPVKFNVRGLWIDPATSRICKALAVWQGLINHKKVFGSVTLDLNADGLIERYSFSATAHFVIATISAHQDGFLTDIRSVSESVWAAAPDH